MNVNKGEDDNPAYRSRLVAREIRLPGQDSIFAPTPPLEALRTVLSMAATDPPGLPRHDRRGGSETRTQISVIDISRAYFNAVKDVARLSSCRTRIPTERVGSAGASGSTCT